jgi:hypothetical protein
MSADQPKDTAALERTGQGQLRTSQGARWGGGRGVALRFFEPSDELHGVRGLARGHCSLGADRAGGNCGPARGGRWGDG